MYSYSLRKKIETLFAKGFSIDEVSESENIEKSSLEAWKKDNDLRERLKGLILQGKIEEVLTEINNFQTEYGKQYCIPYLLAKIESQNGNIEKEKKYLRKRLNSLPDDVKAISSLMRIAKIQGRTIERKELCKKQIEISPDDVWTMHILAVIYIEEGNRGEAKKLLKSAFEKEPNNMRILVPLLWILKKCGDLGEEKETLKKIIEHNPKFGKARRRLRKVEELESQEKCHSKCVEESEEEKKLTPIERVRRMIYGSENMLEDIEKIKELMRERR